MILSSSRCLLAGFETSAHWKKQSRSVHQVCVRAQDGNSSGGPAESSQTPVRKLQSSLLERSMPDKHIIDKAETEIAGYCLTLPGGEAAERCWIAHQHYGDTKRAAEEGCDIHFADGNVNEEECAKLERLEAFARTMMTSGRIGNFVNTLYSLRNYAKKHAEEQAEAAGRDAPEEGPLMSSNEAQDFESRQDELHHLFVKMDRDQNGRLDIGEFRDAMKEMGDELSGQDCSNLLESMDVHGSLTEEDFMAIVEAKGMWEKDTPITKVLRRLSLRPSWFKV